MMSTPRTETYVKLYEFDVFVYGRAINMAAYVPPIIVKALVQLTLMVSNEISHDAVHAPGATAVNAP